MELCAGKQYGGAGDGGYGIGEEEPCSEEHYCLAEPESAGKCVPKRAKREEEIEYERAIDTGRETTLS